MNTKLKRQSILKFYLVLMCGVLINLSWADLPTLLVKKNQGEPSVPLRVAEVTVEVQVVGNVAETVMELRFQNDTDRILEGELVLPLGEERAISRYALEVNGKMREGVMVPKNEARVAFDSIVREQIDPGLVEMTKGNHFRTRIYPIPANGSKSLILGYEEVLKQSSEGLAYELPLMFKDTLSSFSFRLMAEQADVEIEPLVTELKEVNFEIKKGSGWVIQAKEEDVKITEPLKVNIPMQAEPFVSVEKGADGKWFFQVVDQSPVIQAEPELKRTQSYSLLWDTSGSGRNRDIEKELAVLEGLFSGRTTEVRLVTMNIKLTDRGVFQVQNGDWSELRDVLKSLKYDGGTDFSKVDFSKVQEEHILYVGDGVSTIGSVRPKFGGIPISMIVSSDSADFGLLRHLSNRTGGVMVNLSAIKVPVAVKQLSRERIGLQKVSLENVKELQYTAYKADSLVTVYGTLIEGTKTELTLTYKGAKGRKREKVITIDPEKHLWNTSRISRLWAQEKLKVFLQDPKENKEQIIKLGTSYRVLTPYTSLLVLDRLEDYVRYEITPPEKELQAEYKKALHKKRLKERKARKNKNKEFINDLLSVWKGVSDWYDKDYPEELSIIIPYLKEREEELSEIIKVGAESELMKEGQKSFAEIIKMKDSLSALRIKAESLRDTGKRLSGEETFAFRKELKTLEERFAEITLKEVRKPVITSPIVAYSEVDSAGGDPFSPDESSSLSAPQVTSEAKELESDTSTVPQKGTIKLSKWDPKTPYLIALRKTSEDKLEEEYYKWKKDNLNSSAFYLDVADFFAQKEDYDLALRVLTNVAELDLENVPLMRILARRLSQLGEFTMAGQLFLEILELRSDEPQSHRDLALVYEKMERYQDAADKYWTVATQDWDERFSGIQLIALVEWNGIVKKYDINTEGYDQRFMKDLSSDIRIVLEWDADNTDIDLWVTDPMGVKCDYENNLTEAGAKMSIDMTQGYGPEEFLIKRAFIGDYSIEANYYGNSQQNLAGATTIQATVYTNWGRPNEKKQEITLRLKDAQEVVKVGDVSFK